MNDNKSLAIKRKEIDLASLIADETQRRKLITKFISQHMKEGVDFGTIKMVSKRTGKEYESKPSLFKPGSEKFCSLLHLRPIFNRDDETWEMAGKISGVLCYICSLMDNKGNIIGEGRGASDIKEKVDWTLNNAIKIAEKRAQIDAVLRTGGLSDFFTQDLEDMIKGNGDSEKMIQKVTETDVESNFLMQKCKFCGTVGKYHKKGCVGIQRNSTGPSGEVEIASVISDPVGSVENKTPEVPDLICEDCGKPIQHHANYGPSTIASFSQKAFYKKLCWECQEPLKLKK